MEQEQQDLTGYSNSELSMMVFNDEYLYNMRHDCGLMGILNNMFIFTQDQYEQLAIDLEEDQDDV